MLGRKDFTREETDAAKASVAHQLSTFRKLRNPGELEPVFFNAALLALDRRFVHRVRMVTMSGPNICYVLWKLCCLKSRNRPELKWHAVSPEAYAHQSSLLIER